MARMESNRPVKPGTPQSSLFHWFTRGLTYADAVARVRRTWPNARTANLSAAWKAFTRSRDDAARWRHLKPNKRLSDLRPGHGRGDKSCIRLTYRVNYYVGDSTTMRQWVGVVEVRGIQTKRDVLAQMRADAHEDIKSAVRQSNPADPSIRVKLNPVRVTAVNFC